MKAPRKLDVDTCSEQERCNTQVYIDGQQVMRAVAYDCDEGWVRYIPVNDAGQFSVLAGEIVSTKRHGHVTARTRLDADALQKYHAGGGKISGD